MFCSFTPILHGTGNTRARRRLCRHARPTRSVPARTRATSQQSAKFLRAPRRRLCRNSYALRMQPLTSQALDQLFHHAHSHLPYLATPVEDATLVRLYETLRWGPTAANSNPLRITFVRSAEAKARLLPCLAPGNVKKVENAPVTALLAMDLRFFDALPRLFPHVDARSWYEGKPDVIAENALRNSSLQGGYFLLAARALGLGCGPMSGFDAEAVRTAFFEGTALRPNFLCTLGYPDPEAPRRRNPRLEFAEACKLA